ncbi:MAG: hypothetical protein NZ908_01670 [Candidatus Micrarchaeota archaeon]|nr:hypothetical protein [Candidatus Micrarchaeota archaeon]MCX8154418.1 hypothetical protein [Candidatus Micrarchaeota archaeon]
MKVSTASEINLEKKMNFTILEIEGGQNNSSISISKLSKKCIILKY